MQDDVFEHVTHLDLLYRAIFYYGERCSVRRVRTSDNLKIWRKVG